MALWQHDGDDFLSQNRKARRPPRVSGHAFEAKPAGKARAGENVRTRSQAGGAAPGGGEGAVWRGGASAAPGVPGVSAASGEKRTFGESPKKRRPVRLLLAVMIAALLFFLLLWSGVFESLGLVHSSDDNGGTGSGQSSSQYSIEYFNDAELKSTCYHVKNNAGDDLLLFLYTVPGYRMDAEKSSYSPNVFGELDSTGANASYLGMVFSGYAYDKCDWNEKTKSVLEANCDDLCRSNHDAPFTNISALGSYDSSASCKIQIFDQASYETRKEIPVEIKDVTQAEMDAIVSEWATHYNMDTAPNYSS